jgi:hypothetical protein
MSTTARAIISSAFLANGIFALADTIAGTTDETYAFGILNLMMSSFKLQPLTSPTNTRETFALTVGKGGPNNPYTIGPNGDFNTTRPASVSEITGWGLTLPGTNATQVEIPRAMLTDDAWQAIQIKGLPNGLFTDAYYNPTFAGGLGTINLWPVPNTTVNGLVLYRNLPIASFPSVAAVIDLPEGYEEMLGYQLSRRLLTPYGITDQGVVSDVLDMARTTLANIKRANVKLVDLPIDPALTHSGRGGYNIDTGTGG